MKRYFSISTVCVLSLLALGSCSKMLEEPQKGVVAIEDFYQTDDDAKGALVYVYDVMARQLARGDEAIFSPFFGVYEMPSDDIYSAGEFFGDNDQHGGQLNEFRYDSANSNITRMYQGWYKIIYAANLVINYFDGELADSQVKKQCVAEARVIRAYAHMMLAIAWNRPPLADHLLEANELPSQYEGTHEELLIWCAQEAEAAVNDLTVRSSKADKDATARVTKAMAWSTAGKAYMFAGEWNKAKENLKKVVTDDNYALVPSERIRETFHVEGEGNEEIIFACNVLPNSNIDDWSGRIQKSGWMMYDIWGWRNDHWGGKPTSVKGGWGLIGVREDFAADLVANDGYDSARRKAWIRKYDPEVLYEMPYDTDGDMTLEQKKKSADRGIKSYTFGQSEYLHYKRVTDNSDMDGWYSHMNTNVFRLAEIYLLYAEACARTNDNDGLQYLNKIQNRAKSKTVSSSLSLDAVKKEKRFEMWMEGCRWPDMVRWSIQDNDKSIFNSVINSGKHIPSLKDHYYDADADGKPVSTTTAEHSIYVTYDDCPSGQDVGFKAGKHEWMPYPFAETSINPNIGQNPGWGGTAAE